MKVVPSIQLGIVGAPRIGLSATRVHAGLGRSDDVAERDDAFFDGVATRLQK